MSGRSVSTADFRWVEDDPIAPVLIEHRCQETFTADGRLENRYNFLRYSFERAGVGVLCRTYMDEAERVTLYDAHRLGEGPFERVEAPELRQDVLLFLTRRFRLIDRIGEQGLEPVWMSGNYGALLAWRAAQRRSEPPPAELPPHD